ncbi:unknown [Ruminococcus sp. CAG:624]|nr:unknown [Ruminococcus sp. CAG:624]
MLSSFFGTGFIGFVYSDVTEMLLTPTAPIAPSERRITLTVAFLEDLLSNTFIVSEDLLIRESLITSPSRITAYLGLYASSELTEPSPANVISTEVPVTSNSTAEPL